MFNCRTNDEKLLCLKNRGSTSSPNRTWFGTRNVSPAGDHLMRSSVLGSSTILRSLLRNAGLFLFIAAGCGVSVDDFDCNVVFAISLKKLRKSCGFLWPSSLSIHAQLLQKAVWRSSANLSSTVQGYRRPIRAMWPQFLGSVEVTWKQRGTSREECGKHI